MHFSLPFLQHPLASGPALLFLSSSGRVPAPFFSIGVPATLASAALRPSTSPPAEVEVVRKKEVREVLPSQ